MISSLKNNEQYSNRLIFDTLLHRKGDSMETVRNSIKKITSLKKDLN